MATDEATPEWLPPIEPNARPARYRSAWQWLEQGARRQQDGIIVAILAAWAGLPLALWLAAVGVVGGTVAGIVGSSQIGLAHTLHVNEGVGVFAAIAGAFVGALGGFLLIFAGYVNQPASLLGAFLSGLFIGSLALVAMVYAEPRLLRLRGYRELSRREKELLHPILRDAGYMMSLAVAPELWMSDSEKPAAWTHMRAIVVCRGLLDYGEGEAPPQSKVGTDGLAAILVHELHHWEMGHVVGDCMVWACFWPVVLVFNAGCWLQSKGRGLAAIGWFFFWPAWVTTKLIVVPLMSKASRFYEFQADWRAASLGDYYRLGLRKALNELQAWERPRTGWEQALAATHPAIELRLEKLEAPPEVEPLPARPRVEPITIKTELPRAEATPEEVPEPEAPVPEPAPTRPRQPQPTSAAEPHLLDPAPEPSVHELEAPAEPAPPRGTLARTRTAVTNVVPTRRRAKARTAPPDSVQTAPEGSEAVPAQATAKQKKRSRRRASAPKKADQTAESDAAERWLPSKSKGSATPADSPPPLRRPSPPNPPDQ